MQKGFSPYLAFGPDLYISDQKGFSCLEFKRQLGLCRYETAFRLMHKIRAVMGRRDSLYLLKDMVE
jgi:hypothetical protein